MSETTIPEPVASNKTLPPVEPPSAGFLVQLFVIPGLIVVLIVAVWLMFHWLAQMGNDAQAYVEALRSDSPSRWRSAFNLSQALRSDGNLELKQDEAAAQQIADMLRAELAQPVETAKPSEGLNREQRIKAELALRYYLASALGYFHSPKVLPALLKAATTSRTDDDQDIRRAALESIARLSLTRSREYDDKLSHPGLVDTLIEATREKNTKIREAATFALGTLDDSRVAPRLREQIYDEEPSVRFNAATGLAMRGDTAATPVLIEMLDPVQEASTSQEPEQFKEGKRVTVIVNGLRGAAELARLNNAADLTALIGAIEPLADDSSAEVRDHAKAVLARLKQPAEASTKKGTGSEPKVDVVLNSRRGEVPVPF
jgi:HEAT repeat protein